MKRTSVVNELHTISLINSSIYEIGDAYQANPVTRAIAVQKGGYTFQGDLNFNDYSIFRQKPNLPATPPNILKRTINHHPFILVDLASITAVSTSSIVQVGNLNHLKADSRIKHFRIVLNEGDMNNT